MASSDSANSLGPSTNSRGEAEIAEKKKSFPFHLRNLRVKPRLFFGEQLIDFLVQIDPAANVPQHSFFIDQPHARQSAHAKLIGDLLSGRRLFEQLRPGHALTRNDLLERLAIFIGTDANDFKSLLMELFVSGFDIGKLPHARPAPGSPEVDQDD